MHAAADTVAPVIAILPPDVYVRALSGAVYARPTPMVLMRPMPPYSAGDTLHLLYSLGEGFFRAIDDSVFNFGDPTGVVALPGERCPSGLVCIGRLLHPLRAIWWVHLRLPSEELGWVWNAEDHFAGTDACGVEEPPLDTMLAPRESAFTVVDPPRKWGGG
ncbi:MAG TPA: hypothetical protein VFT57_00290 [Gemmatimonadaceae bacterium]|nr:hypothetical protein [Gemmatimonadaceae bacterium]